MPADRLPRRLAEAGDDLEHAVGEPGLGGELREPKRGQRRLLRGLEDDAVARRERGTELPRGHHQGEVPRHDRADDAERLADDRDVRVGPGRARSRRRPCRSPRRTRRCTPWRAARRRSSRRESACPCRSSRAAQAPRRARTSAPRASGGRACASSGRGATRRRTRRRRAPRPRRGRRPPCRRRRPVATTSPVIGLTQSNVSPETASTYAPSTNAWARMSRPATASATLRGPSEMVVIGCLRRWVFGAPASAGSMTRMVRAPSPRRSRSSAGVDAVERVERARRRRRGRARRRARATRARGARLPASPDP